MRTWLILIVASLLSISGCATIVSGTTQSVTIQSTPAGASVFIDGVEKGVTPLTLELKRKADTTLKVSKEGYQDVTMPLPTKFNSMFWGNIIIGGLFVMFGGHNKYLG